MPKHRQHAHLLTSKHATCTTILPPPTSDCLDYNQKQRLPTKTTVVNIYNDNPFHHFKIFFNKYLSKLDTWPYVVIDCWSSLCI